MNDLPIWLNNHISIAGDAIVAVCLVISAVSTWVWAERNPSKTVEAIIITSVGLICLFMFIRIGYFQPGRLMAEAGYNHQWFFANRWIMTTVVALGMMYACKRMFAAINGSMSVLGSWTFYGFLVLFGAGFSFLAWFLKQ